MSAKPEYANKRFLIVDDEAFMLGLLERVLRQFNVGTIVKANDGATALRSVKDDLTQVDYIISDFNMKPVNGLQLLQAIRMGGHPRIPRDQPFIMVTGNGETEVVRAAIQLDVSGYLVKPVSPNKLSEALDRISKKPIQLKAPEFYKSVDVQAMESFNDAEAKRTTAWVILSQANAVRDKAAVEDKIAKFKNENGPINRIDEVKAKNWRQCDLADIKENMILGEDIEAEEGTVLLRKGTALTKMMIFRLRELAVETDSRVSLWVGEPA